MDGAAEGEAGVETDEVVGRRRPWHVVLVAVLVAVVAVGWGIDGDADLNVMRGDHPTDVPAGRGT